MSGELVRQLSSGLDEAASENIRLLKECGALRRELLKAKAVTSDNDTELVACRRRQAMAEKRAEELNAELTDLKLLLLQLNAKETKNTDIVKDLQNTAEEYKTRNNILEQRLASTQRELEEQREYEDVIEAECTRLELDVRQLTAALGDLRTALAEAEEDKAGAEKRREQMQREVSHLREELAALETGSVPKATAERLSLELANARMALDTYAKQVRRLEEKLESMDRQHERREEQHMERMAQIEALDTQLRGAQRREADALGELELLRGQIERYRRDVLEARLVSETLRDNEDRLRAELRLANERTAMAIRVWARLREAEDEENTDDEGLESCDSVGSGIGDELSFAAASDDEEMSGTAINAEGGEGGDGARDTDQLASDEVAANTAFVDDRSDPGATDAADCAMPEAACDGGDAAVECPVEELVARAPTSESPAADIERQERPQAAVSEDNITPAPSEEQAEDQPLTDVPTPKKRRDRRGHARYSNLGDLCAEKGASHAPRMVSQAIEQASIGGQ